MTNSETTETIKKQGFWSKIGLLPTKKVAQISINSMLKGKKIIIPVTLNKLNSVLIKITPSKIRLSLMSKIFRKGLK